MVIPEHVENYLRYYKRYVHSIFIYEHLGSESDNAKFPQCEILTGIDPNIGVNYSVLSSSIFQPVLD